MKALMSTAASRAWLGVALVGFVVVALVVGLALIPRLGAGQRVIDAAEPAFTDERVAGTRAGIDLVSQYVDLADSLVTPRGGGREDVGLLIRIIRRRRGLSTAQVRRILRREAPHTEALTRALPLDGVADEVPRLTSYLATRMNLVEEELAATLERGFPQISRVLTVVRNVTDGWYDVPGIERMTRLRSAKPVRTVPELRAYYREDLVPLMVEHRSNFQDLAGRGGIGYIPYLLAFVGLGVLAFGLLQARRAATAPPGRLAWGVVVGVGVVILAVVGAARYYPRLGGAQELITDFEPAFVQQRVRGAANGIDTVHDAIALGDPIATRRGAAAGEAPRLYRFVAGRTGVTVDEVRRALRRQVPQTVALLDAIPLTEVANEVPHLVGYLSQALRMSGDEVVVMLRKRTPGLARSLLSVSGVAVGWNAIPGTERMTRLDGVTPVRTMPEFDDYLRQDLIPVLVDGREDFDTLASRWPPVDLLAPLLLLVGLLVTVYGGVMMRSAARGY